MTQNIPGTKRLNTGRLTVSLAESICFRAVIKPVSILHRESKAQQAAIFTQQTSQFLETVTGNAARTYLALRLKKEGLQLNDLGCASIARDENINEAHII